MIYKVKSFGPITENSFNMHFCININIFQYTVY